MSSTPPPQIIQHRSAHGAWDLARALPPADLRSHVLDLSGFEELLPSPVLRHEVATAKVVWIVSFGAPFELFYRHETDGYAVREGSFVAGLHDRAAQNRSTGRSHCLQVNFTLLGARLFFARPLQDLTNRIVALPDLLGGEAGRLEDRLAALSDWPARFALVTGLIRQRVHAAAWPGRDLLWAWRRIEESGGACGIGGLALALGVSRKHLVQRFRREIGLPPKTLARMLRFERAVADLTSGRQRSLAALALEAGYYDQAHFNRDFRAFAGFSPGEYLTRLLPDGTGVLAD